MMDILSTDMKKDFIAVGKGFSLTDTMAVHRSIITNFGPDSIFPTVLL